jgi:hypothetical protein
MKAIIVIPGYKGSTLVDRHSGELAWLKAGQLLPSKDDHLSLKLASDLSTNLVSKDIFADLKLVPALLTRDIYKNLLSELRENLADDTVIESFAYDWRKEFTSHLVPLDQKIKQLRDRGMTEITIIAHSLGALIAMYYLRYGTQLPQLCKENWYGTSAIIQLITLGCPFGGTLMPFCNLQFGDHIGLNKRILSRDVVASLPIAYQLLPKPGLDAVVNNLIDLPIDLYNISNWIENGIYPGRTGFDAQKQCVDIQAYLDTAFCLYNGVNKIDDILPEISPMIVNIVGTGYQTKEQVLWREKRVEKIISGEGDGTVTMDSAVLPAAYQLSGYQEYFVNAKHAALLSNSNVIDLILEHLR